MRMQAVFQKKSFFLKNMDFCLELLYKLEHRGILSVSHLFC